MSDCDFDEVIAATGASLRENDDSPADVAITSDDLLATDQLISLREAASKVGLSPDSLRRYALQGKLQARKIGRNWVTTIAAVEHYMSRRDASKAPKNRRKSRSASITLS